MPQWLGSADLILCKVGVCVTYGYASLCTTLCHGTCVDFVMSTACSVKGGQSVS